MGKHGKTINLRLSAELSEQLDRLADAVPGLQKGALIRLVMSATLRKPLDEQIEVVTAQLLKPDVHPVKAPMNNRLKGVNAKYSRES